MELDIVNDISLYLPQYLSEDGLKELKAQLRDFSHGDEVEYFANNVADKTFLLQGDCTIAPYMNIPDTTNKEINVLIISNTCDMSLDNKRPNECRIMYIPIIKLDKYENSLCKRHISEETIKSHIDAIKQQIVSQIMYIPYNNNMGSEGVALFDRAISIPLNEDNANKLLEKRLFTLSNFGFYLLLLKLSYHFTRVQEKINRD